MRRKRTLKAVIPDTYQQAALLVIDVQQALFEKRLPIYQADALLKNINQLVNKAHQAQVTVVYIQHSGKGDLGRSEPGWQLHPAMQPEPGNLRIHKIHGDAFQETELLDELNARQVGRLVITGLVTNGCVMVTSESAISLGYRVTLAADAHSTYSEKAAELIASLNQNMEEQGASILIVEEIEFEPS
ncbi:MAG: isochorismatase family protein [Anaerolineales bacterium]